jgi:hypoxanthine phosphoribosyltransferase
MLRRVAWGRLLSLDAPTTISGRQRRPVDNDLGILSERIDRVVVTREQIAARVAQLAGQIAEHYRGRELSILAVMTGSLVFLADLIRKLPLVMRLEILSVSSYPDGAMRSRGVKAGPLPADFRGKHVLIIDDILDTGSTIDALGRSVKAAGAASIRTCVLLRKRHPRPVLGKADFVGLEIDDEFVVGYGLDYDNLYRNLPDICVLKPPGSGRP